MNRRKFLASAGAAVVGVVLVRTADAKEPVAARTPPSRVIKPGRLNLSASRWPWGKFSLDDMCKMCRELGMQGVDLLEPPDWEVPRRYGLVCSMGYAPVAHPENRLSDG